jgi:hypothetical protein
MLGVVTINDAVAAGGKNCSELVLALDQGRISEILPISPKQIKGDEARIATPKE